MRSTLWVLAAVVGVTAIASQSAGAQLGQVELVAALRMDLVRAEFRGDGDSSVVGRIWGAPGGPQQVTIDPGTQFWAQLGGRQGMGTLGKHTIDLGQDRYAEIRLPTVCTNLGLPEPTRRDIMIPQPCPDARVARVAALAGDPKMPYAAFQVAVWAIANDPPVAPVEKYLAKVVKKAKRRDKDAEVTPESLMAAAAQLLRKASVNPKAFVLFGGAPAPELRPMPVE